MAATIITGMATTFNLPNYVGELFLVSPTDTPLLSAIGGLNGAHSTDTLDFGFTTEELPAASQPANLEGEAAPTPTEIGRVPGAQNCVQIFHESVSISYTKQADKGQHIPILAGSTADEIGGIQPIQDEMSNQLALKLKKIAQDVEYTFWNGVYARPADNNSARKSRGILNAVNLTTIASGGAQLDSFMFTDLLLAMKGVNAPFVSPIVFCSAYTKTRISNAWGYAPQSRTIGGLNIEQIVTDFGNFGITLARYLPAGVLAIVDVAKVFPVFLNIEGKGYLFTEPLAKTGASTQEQIYGEIGLDYGMGEFHGVITGLPTVRDAA